MFKDVIISLTVMISLCLVQTSFAISPGTVEAQTRNNMQQMQMNKQQIKHMKQMRQNNQKAAPQGQPYNPYHY